MVIMVLSDHLGRHLEYLIFPKSDEVAPDGFGFSTLKLPRISQKTLSVPKFEVELKMPLFPPDYKLRLCSYE